MPWTFNLIVHLLLLAVPTNAQFGEIASLATSLLGTALGNGGTLGALAGAGAGAGQAAGALGQIGQLYQLAQGALQLTGTGVGVLNQASEGNWFPAVLEQTAKNSQSLMGNRGVGGGGLNLGPLAPVRPAAGGGGIGPEFGENFPAPNIEDYDENVELPTGNSGSNTPKPPDGLIDIDSGDTDTDIINPPATISPSTEEITLFPDTVEEKTPEPPATSPSPRQIRIQLPDKTGNTQSSSETDSDYESLISKTDTTNIETNSNTIIVEENTDPEVSANIIATHGTKTQPAVPPLNKLVDVLKKSKLSEQEIKEIVNQVEGNSKIAKPPKIDFNSSVQNIPEKKNNIRQKITEASRALRENLNGEEENMTKVSKESSSRGGRHASAPYAGSRTAPVITPRYIAPRPVTLPVVTTVPVPQTVAQVTQAPLMSQIPQLPLQIQTPRPILNYPGYAAPPQPVIQPYGQPQAYGLHTPAAQNTLYQHQQAFLQQQQQQQAYFQQLHSQHEANVRAAIAQQHQYRPTVMQQYAVTIAPTYPQQQIVTAAPPPPASPPPPPPPLPMYVVQPQVRPASPPAQYYVQPQPQVPQAVAQALHAQTVYVGAQPTPPRPQVYQVQPQPQQPYHNGAPQQFRTAYPAPAQPIVHVAPIMVNGDARNYIQQRPPQQPAHYVVRPTPGYIPQPAQVSVTQAQAPVYATVVRNNVPVHPRIQGVKNEVIPAETKKEGPQRIAN